MSIDTAIFRNTNGITVLLCNKCGNIVKDEREFSQIESFAMSGVISLEAQYCYIHKYLGLIGSEKKKEIERLGIKEQLREGIMKKNTLGALISRPNQKLIIMRGIPGSGKSTKANTLVGEGIIHSTDTVIESIGDYASHFARMIESGDWTMHSKVHHMNFVNAANSMKEGVSPVIVDNTNIKAVEAKKYVEAALAMGLDESNILIIDVADGGQTAEILAERNTHNVPLVTIKRMLASHKGVGVLTVNKILESDGGIKPPKVLYTAVVLDAKSSDALIRKYSSIVPEGWNLFCSHMTILFGKPLEDRSEIGKEVTLDVSSLGISDKAIAVSVKGYQTVNAIPHITIAVNLSGGGKPYDSNNITDWVVTDFNNPLKLHGVVTEIKAY
jgi:predicted kinase